ncbi:hypothetical protein EPA93_47580 [Ktedonosporobacter rubrisoli]|uniref:DAGKc domain-containing protein n=1 Tax=Ktedonosporobacter rubrisoli TaxID=2509675 RepID=A0A4V0Z0H3_KTERU|nr:diacylglycerol kinase family protein [Ktedonosporobacter rubrisoli]QBD83221.1 hypothetical protein EPA93_47580 [Ktedonosporobacter rubrisoli]
MHTNLFQPHRAIVIHSPHAGRASQLSQVLDYVRQAGIEIIETLAITELDGLPVQGQHWRDAGCEIAIAAGGDGLIGGVITHIARSHLPLGILPLGTANDIARSLNIPLNIQEAAELIGHGKLVAVDIGEAVPAEQAPHGLNPQIGGRSLASIPRQHHGFFAHTLTTGLNVQFARLATNVATRQRYGRLTYPVAALEVLRNYQALEVSLRMDGAVWPSGTSEPAAAGVVDGPITVKYHALQVAVINAPIFGGAWQLSIPGAAIDDQLLDIIIIEEIDLKELSAAIARIFNPQVDSELSPTGEYIKYGVLHPAELVSGISGVHHFQARGVTIITSTDPQDITLDGELRGRTPTYACTAKEQLQVVVPA